jgi:hypothetical protein
MFNVFKNVIENRNFELKGIIKKIDTLWAQSSITDDERAELISLAQSKANVQQSIDVMQKLEELDKRMKVVEEMLANNDTDSDDTEVVYADYEVGKWYYNGDIVRFEDVLYKCVAPDGVVCVWSPSDYPTYWEVTE